MDIRCKFGDRKNGSMYQVFIFGGGKHVQVVYATDVDAAIEVANCFNRKKGSRKAIVYPQAFEKTPFPGFEKEHAELMELRGE